MPLAVAAAVLSIPNGLWANVLEGLKKGDYMLIQFGLKRRGPLNTGRHAHRFPEAAMNPDRDYGTPRRTGKTVYTFGHYLRIYIRQAKPKARFPYCCHRPRRTADWRQDTEYVRNLFQMGRRSRPGGKACLLLTLTLLQALVQCAGETENDETVRRCGPSLLRRFCDTR